MEKILKKNSWKLNYDPLKKKNEYIELDGSADRILEKIISQYPAVFVVTFQIDKTEPDDNARCVFNQALDFVQDKEKVILGNRQGIISVMLKDFEGF